MSGVSSGFGRVLNFQINLTPVTTISGSPVTLFTYTIPSKFTQGPGQGILVQAIWQHTTGATSTTYNLGGTNVGAANTSVAVQSAESYIIAQTSGVVTTNRGIIVGNTGTTAGGFNSVVTLGNFTGALTYSLTANAASNTDVITPIFWLVTEVK